MSGRNLAKMISPDLALPPELIAEAISWRHHLHRHPELAYREYGTADFIASQLRRFGLSVHRGLAGTGVIGTLRRGRSARTIAIRADMDALRVQEHSDVPHASATPGLMHACGHDGHVAMSLAAARLCAQLPDLDGTVHFIYQPAEEGGGGARRMVEEGLFEQFACDAIYALHNWPALPLGTCVALDGVMMAANAVFEITVSGRGCHGAMPHEGSDCIVAGAQLISALQSIVSRNIDPLSAGVVSVTQIHAGHAHNVIPDSCVISGATRWTEERVGNMLESRIAALSESIAAALGCTARIRYERRYPATVNDTVAARFVRSVVETSLPHLTVVDARPSMGSEDFAFMLQTRPGCYMWLGSGALGKEHGLHSPHYDFNDEVLPLGAALWVALVRKSLMPAA